MEVCGGEVLVIFPYDAVLKDDLKSQLPWPMLSFTKYPVPAWLVKPEPDAVRKIAQWAEDKGFTVSLDVWAIANGEGAVVPNVPKPDLGWDVKRIKH